MTVEKLLGDFGITKIGASGFKSLHSQSEVEVRSLTILAGANSSGKSSIMQPLLMMKQTLEAAYDPGALLIRGPNVDFTSVEQFISKSKVKDNQNLIINLQVTGLSVVSDLSNTFEFPILDNRHGIELSQMAINESFGKSINDSKRMVISPEMTQEEINHLFPSFTSFRWLGGTTGEDLGKWHVIQNRCFFTLDAGPFDFRGMPLGGRSLVNPAQEFETEIVKLIHVRGLRGNPERTYSFTPVVGPVFQGRFDDYFASVIYAWQDNKDNLFNSLEAGLQTLQLTSNIFAKRINDVQLELQVGRTLRSNSKDTVSLADVGFGVSQVLPVLVALLVAEPGQLVYIEQPELHLHPRAQVALAQVLADAANRGVRVVVETHSSLLLLGIQTLIAEGKLSPDKTILHWFTRDEDGMTTIRSEIPDENGAYGEWPVDFDDIELNAQKRYLDAVAHREMGI